MKVNFRRTVKLTTQKHFSGMQGPKGRTGDQGIVGPNGAKGSVGMVGLSGDRGNKYFAVLSPQVTQKIHYS